MQQRLLTRLLLAIALLLCTVAKATNLGPIAPEVTAPKIAIIIDDIGYLLSEGQQTLKLPQPVTLSVIPFTPYGVDLAQNAHDLDIEIMLHAPMEISGNRPWENGLKENMSRQEIQQKLDDMLRNIPNVAGVNNHGGSKLTERLAPMTWVMERLKADQLYFIDSRTSINSQAAHAAAYLDLNYASRDVFLDNTLDAESIRHQITRLKNKARKHGHAIAIGHPHKLTLEILQQEIPQLKNEGFELLKVSELLDYIHTPPAS
ncbi:divergent polysaccharide deacetylase family protein [Teredinibacter sp. KSP-S5-2]|uniref:divergent polysaccharide deacetylase family protein n=1 Tax=Teredinibacter sp. KSP-S5-2 TaxID=3034506 RepID=UPI002934DA74|nr:divergent polysaccharide deacetylase family protein [Teredinibacter sp. KSP-S5-2]WNO08818.1 divergent polysaccharide deacetylase family protein [Teredinibacter sp. KSP-S5-2]